VTLVRSPNAPSRHILPLRSASTKELVSASSRASTYVENCHDHFRVIEKLGEPTPMYIQNGTSALGPGIAHKSATAHRNLHLRQNRKVSTTIHPYIPYLLEDIKAAYRREDAHGGFAPPASIENSCRSTSLVDLRFRYNRGNNRHGRT
jgi:hypothetical protein